MEWLKKYGALAGSVMAIVGFVSAGIAYGENVIDARVKIQLAEMVKKQDLDALSRRFTGVQEQINGSASDNRVIKEKLQHIERQQTERQNRLISAWT